MNISHDQAWLMERITKRYGYNQGFRVSKASGNNIVISYTAPAKDGMYERHVVEVDGTVGVVEFIIVPQGSEDVEVSAGGDLFFQMLNEKELVTR